ncbi:hypothetical protein VC83_03398 [Pseudogymnoascus destructans]|uniref:BZIP domain-containing protein n=1 Tax=Pseudogymnoascus destructans TaxID=655981 RepID=A0A177AEX0_9PEZI|nr:uncharacterized protein VC83_03398 [Pseudogymnoascus destructans]OAF60655.2 hypothetical protein VC83_03398 [Pseudogymnoascus destructans]
MSTHGLSRLPMATAFNLDSTRRTSFRQQQQLSSRKSLRIPFDNSLFTDALTTYPSPNTSPAPPPNNPTAQNPNPQHPSHRRRRTVGSPRSESSTSQDTSHGPISQRLKSQNRTSQRAFRYHRTERFLALQSRVADLEKQLDAAKVVNQLLAQMSRLRSLEELRDSMGGGGVLRSGREGERETGEAASEPPACEEGGGFQTCELPLLGVGEYWDAMVGREGGFEEDDGVDWQAVGLGEGSLSEASPFGRVLDWGWA